MSEYTKERHQRRKEKVQRLLDLLLNIAEDTGLKAGESLLLVGSSESFPRIEVVHIRPLEDMRFFTLSWRVQDDPLVDSINMQYNAISKTVDDSSQFNKDGKYMGYGHIQCWHDHYQDEEKFFVNLYQVIESIKNWELSVYSENLLFHK